MKYFVAGTSEANEAEVIASLESLWDAADEQGVPFELLFREGDLSHVPLPGFIHAWATRMECLLEVAPDNSVLPAFDIALLLVGEEPDEYTLGMVSYYINDGVEVRDLAGQMVQLEWETEKLPQEPVEEVPEETPMVSASLSGGWPGEEPQSLPTASAPEKSREVPAKAPASTQVDPAALLKDVDETDLERMPLAALKGLVDKLGIEADKRSKGGMINAIMEMVIALDKSPGMYDQDADDFMESMPEKPVDTTDGRKSLKPGEFLTPERTEILDRLIDQHEADKAEKMLRTPREWEKGRKDGREVVDPDGWRRDGKSFEEPIPESEYEERSGVSTCSFKRPHARVDVSSMEPAQVTMTKADGTQQEVTRVPLREEFPTSPWDSPPTAVVLEVVCHDGSSKKKVIMAPFSAELSNIVNSF